MRRLQSDTAFEGVKEVINRIPEGEISFSGFFLKNSEKKVDIFSDIRYNNVCRETNLLRQEIAAPVIRRGVRVV